MNKRILNILLGFCFIACISCISVQIFIQPMNFLQDIAGIVAVSSFLVVSLFFKIRLHSVYVFQGFLKIVSITSDWNAVRQYYETEHRFLTLNSVVLGKNWIIFLLLWIGATLTLLVDNIFHFSLDSLFFPIISGCFYFIFLSFTLRPSLLRAEVDKKIKEMQTKILTAWGFLSKNGTDSSHDALKSHTEFITNQISRLSQTIDSFFHDLPKLQYNTLSLNFNSFYTITEQFFELTGALLTFKQLHEKWEKIQQIHINTQNELKKVEYEKELLHSIQQKEFTLNTIKKDIFDTLDSFKKQQDATVRSVHEEWDQSLATLKTTYQTDLERIRSDINLSMQNQLTDTRATIETQMTNFSTYIEDLFKKTQNTYLAYITSLYSTGKTQPKGQLQDPISILNMYLQLITDKVTQQGLFEYLCNKIYAS